MSELILGQTDRIQEALDEVFECNKREYLQIMVRLLPYDMPKATSIETVEAQEIELVQRMTDVIGIRVQCRGSRLPCGPHCKNLSSCLLAITLSQVR